MVDRASEDVPVGVWARVLSANGLLFPDPADEAQFAKQYVENPKRLHQAALILGAFLFYVFFLWDRIIDPDTYQYTQAIRGLVVVPVFLIATVLLGVKRLAKYSEVIILIPTVLGNVGLTVIYCILKNGMDYGSVGIVLVTLGVFTTVKVRISYLLVYCLLTMIVFNVGQALDHTPIGVAGINNLSIVTACALGLFSAYNREKDWRAIFVMGDQLRLAKSSLVARITISYRRSDSAAITGRLFDRLAAHFGYDSVFMDIDAIPLGVDFRKYIDQALQRTDFVLVIIGSHWLGSRENGVLRIDDPMDPVRVELEASLRNGLTVIPVLVDGASMPLESELPEPLKELVYINAAEVATGKDFQNHVDRLIAFLNDSIKARNALGAQKRMGGARVD